MSVSELDGALERLRALAARGETVADEPAGKALLAAAGVAVPRGWTVATPAAAQAMADELAARVALKAMPAGVAHKSDVGAVRGPLDPADVSAAATALQARLPGPLLVEEWLEGEVQCFLGVSVDGAFGPLVSFGVGGLWVELVRDVAHRLAPVSSEEADDMVSSLQAEALFDGYRGAPATDREALAATIARVSELAVAPELSGVVAEIDVNPLLQRADGEPVALDCTVVLAEAESA